MKLLVLSTLGAAAILLSAMMGAGCTVAANDNNADGSAPATTTHDAASPDAGVVDSGACLKDEGRGPFCHADNTAEVPAKCGAQCDTASNLFKSDLARSIVDCMDDEVALHDNDAGADACEAAAKNCVPKAVLLACTDDVSSLCDAAVAKCAGDTFTKDECVQYMRGTTAKGRELLNTCLAENGSSVPSKELCTDCLEAIQSLRGE